MCDWIPGDPLERCAFVLANCTSDDIQPGRLGYLPFLYCSLNNEAGVNLLPLGILLLILWLVFLFVCIATAAADFFSPNISTVAKLLKLPADVAGVTLVAWGNAVNDIIGNTLSLTYANSVGLSFGGFLGSGMFLSCVVTGLIAIMGKGDAELVAASAIRDLVVYLLGLAMAGTILATGMFYWWEGVLFLTIYAVYVAVILVMANEHLTNQIRAWLGVGGTRDGAGQEIEEGVDLDILVQEGGTMDPQDGIAGESTGEMTRLPPIIQVESYDDILEEVEGVQDEAVVEDVPESSAAMAIPELMSATSKDSAPPAIAGEIPSESASKSDSMPPADMQSLSAEDRGRSPSRPALPHLHKIRTTHRRSVSQPVARIPDPEPLSSAVNALPAINTPSNSNSSHRPSHSITMAPRTPSAISSNASPNVRPGTAATGSRLPLRYREYTPTIRQQKDLSSGQFSLPRRKEGVSPIGDQHSFDQRSTATSTFPVTDSPLGTLDRSNFTYAVELWNMWKKNKLQAEAQQQPPSTEPTPQPPETSTSMQKYLTPVTSSTTKRKSFHSATTDDVERQSRHFEGCSDVRLIADLMVMNDRCPTCFKCSAAERGSAENDESSVIALYHVARAPRQTFMQWFHINVVRTAGKHFYPILWLWSTSSWLGRISLVVSAVPTFLLSLTVPVVASLELDDVAESITLSPRDETTNAVDSPSGQSTLQRKQSVDCRDSTFCSAGHRVYWLPWRHRWITLLQLVLAPLFIVFASRAWDPEIPWEGFPLWATALLVGFSVALVVGILSRSGYRLVKISSPVPAVGLLGTGTTMYCDNPDCMYCSMAKPLPTWKQTVLQRYFTVRYWKFKSWHNLLSLAGFVSGLMWIYLLSAEIISVLKALGLALHISESMLGLTVFAFGNSVGDFATNLMLARIGFYSMAVGASWGAPLVNLYITLGISITILQPASLTKDQPIDFSPVLFVTLSGLLVVHLCNLFVLGWRMKFRLSRAYGIFLISMWLLMMVINIPLEIVYSNRG